MALHVYVSGYDESPLYIHRHTGSKTSCLNLGSYNYLGFAEDTGPCADAAYQSTLNYGAGTCSPARELGIYIHNIHFEALAMFTFNEDFQCGTVCVTFI